ncbi:MAG: peptide ABC transporter substrate-binding protein [Cellulomonadaceae bacterium]|nr:peptide ABC transporter substrate-binding protein [Cellulomonadaceae bacterium]
MRRRLVAAATAALVLALTACGGGSGTTSDDSSDTSDLSSITIGEIAFPTSLGLEGRSTAHQGLFFGAVYDSLLRQADDGSLAPGLATEWSYDDARTTLSLTLRDDVTFSDGTALDADAVVANLLTFRDSSTPDAGNAQYITDAVADDATHVTITLSVPDPMLTRWFTGTLGWIQSPASLDDPESATTPVGSGPYVLDTENTVTGSVYVYTKNPDYWDDSFQRWDTFTINSYTDQSALLNALQGGQLDAATFLDAATLPQVESAGYTAVTSESVWSGLIFYDRDGTVDPALGDVRVRQAINYALDRETMLATLQAGAGTVTTQAFGPGTTGYDEDLDSYYSFDVDKAKELLAEAGYADGFSLNMPTTAGINPDVFTSVQQQLGDIGITVTLTDTGTNFVTDLLAGKYTSSWMQLTSAIDWQFTTLGVATTAPFNPFKNETAETAALLATMQSGTDDEATAAAQELNQYLVENAWFAPFYRIQTIYVSKPAITVQMPIDTDIPYIYQIQPAS